MKKLLKILLVSFMTISLFTKPTTKILANNDKIEDNSYGYVIYSGNNIVYKGLVYDLSTKYGNLQLLLDNPNMTVDEYTKIFKGLIQNIDTGIAPLALVPGGGGGTGYTYFSDMSWFYRSTDGWNLKLLPLDITRLSLQNATLGWKEVVKMQEINSHWSNEDSLESQYFCHYTFANGKEDWNLAPSIPYRNAMEWVSNRCN